MENNLNEAAEKYASNMYDKDSSKTYPNTTEYHLWRNKADNFIAGAQWQVEQKQTLNTEAAEKGYDMTNGEYYTRLAWDETCKERDELKNQVKALSAIKSGLEKSLTEAFEQLKQKQVPTDLEIEKLAEREYPSHYTNEVYRRIEDDIILSRDGFIKGFKQSRTYGTATDEACLPDRQAIEKLAEKEYPKSNDYNAEYLQHVFIKGFKSALQYTKPVWVEDILEQVERKINAISEIHGKPEKASVIGNSIVLFFKDKSVYKQSFISKETIKAVLDESALQYSVGDDTLFKFCKFIGNEGYKINGYDDSQLIKIIELFKAQPPINK